MGRPSHTMTEREAYDPIGGRFVRAPPAFLQ
jgi:hypothetical protein